MNWHKYPLKSLEAWNYKRRIRGWTSVPDLYLRGQSMSWVKLPFLEAVAKAAKKAKGPVLECGSGLTTAVLRSFGHWTVSLEQHVGWAMKTGALHRPIDWNTGWYGWEGAIEAFGLVVVDGPDGGDRAGFLGRANLLTEATILIDDTHNWWEGRRVVEEIERHYPCKSVERVGNKDYSFTVVTTGGV